MRIAGIITEYNPFHNGHAYHIARTRDAGATHIAVVMGGNFLQRGEPALLSKFARTSAALAGGADLVIELPLPWSMAPAEHFAFGAVSILHALGCADLLSFGVEAGKASQLLPEAARAIDSPALKQALRPHLDQGLPFAKARQLAVAELIGEEAAGVLSHPNNTLGIEYLRALFRLGSSIEPLFVPRKGTRHDSPESTGPFASAAHIRTLVHAGEPIAAFLPQESMDILRMEVETGRAPASVHLIERAVLARLRQMPVDKLRTLPDVSEGLEHRIAAAVSSAASLPELYAAIKSKRYTHARIRRICMAAFLGLPADFSRETPPYIRILGFNGRGREILNAAKSKASLPIVTRVLQTARLGPFARSVFALERRASDLYALAMPAPSPCNTDYTTGVIVTHETNS